MNTIARAFAVLLAVLLGTVLLVAPASASTAAACQTPWGSQEKDDPLMGLGEVDSVRAGRHPCFDRLVVDIDGPVAGFNVRYVDQITQDASGFLVPTRGAGKRLQVVVRHPSFSRLTMPNVAGFTTFRQVVFAGSFEGQTTLGIGLRNGPLPFRVFTIPGGHGRLVVDVAHKW